MANTINLGQSAFKGIIGGTAAAAATHPFEMAQIGTQNLPKTIDIRDQYGNVIGQQKNPARYGKFKIPFSQKEIEFDKGDSWQHFLARVPKGIASWGAGFLVGDLALNAITKGKYKGKYF